MASLLPIAKGNARRAAEMAGLDLDDDELAALMIEAKDGFSDLVAGGREAGVGLVSQSIGVLGARLIANAPSVPSAVLASSLKSASSALEQMNGGARPVYVPCRIAVYGFGWGDSGGKVVTPKPPPPPGAFRAANGEDYVEDPEGHASWWSDVAGGPAKTGSPFCPVPRSKTLEHGTRGAMGDVLRWYSRLEEPKASEQ